MDNHQFSQLRVDPLTPELVSSWDAYVSKHQLGSTYHLALWRSYFEETMRKRCSYLVATADGAVVGILPSVFMESRLTGRFTVSLPFLNYGGVLADSERIRGRLVAAAVEQALDRSHTHIELRELVESDDEETRSDKVAMYLELPDSIEGLSKKLGSKLRSQIRRPTREGATATVGGVELLDDFYQVFARNMRDLGTPVYAKSMFRAAMMAGGAESRLVCAYVNGRPAAGGLLIGHFGRRLEIPWASAVRDYNKISINMLLYWECLQYAVEAGYSVFDFGRSTRDTGTFKFKRQWGAEPIQLYWNYWLREGYGIPALNPSNPRYAKAIWLWRRLPLFVTRLVGPSIVRNLP